MKRIRVHNLRLSLDDDRSILAGLAAERLGLPRDSIGEVCLARRSLDARHKHRMQWVYTVDVSLPEDAPFSARGEPLLLKDENPLEGLTPGTEPLPERPVIVGCGPAGLFAAYLLGLYGYRPLVIDRGAAVRDRVRQVRQFWAGGPHDPESNLLFGEGGAGTFSDGKLTCRSSSPLVPFILRIMVENRAPEEILYEARPHIGTDRLRAVLVTLRKCMAEMGVEFKFEVRLDDLALEGGRASGLKTSAGPLPCGPLLLGIGHSARDTYQMLLKRGVQMEFKPFQYGVRVEHPQELIDQAQYGLACGHPKLGAAEYVLTRKSGAKRRPVFSFCMCPGGLILPSISEGGMLCVNGMSNHKRDSGWANSGIVVTVGLRETGGKGPLCGIEFQRHYERLAYRLGGANYAAPAQAIPDFLEGRLRGRPLEMTYPRGYLEADLREVMPRFASRAIASALKEFGQKIPGFTSERGTMTGPESRGSSPVRILRDDSTRESVSLPNLYPIGEGAGYAGGIISAALDGVTTASKIIGRFAPPAR